MKEGEAVQKALEDAAEQHAEKEDSSYYPSCNLEQPEAEQLPRRSKRRRTIVASYNKEV
jgi:hypothetical protein